MKKFFKIIYGFRIVLLGLIVIASFAHSGERGKAGLKLNLEINGMFSPKIDSAMVANVEEDSAAEKAGILEGHRVLKIGDCAIPGCKASVAKKAMNKSPGEIVVLVLQNESGKEYTATLTLQ